MGWKREELATWLQKLGRLGRETHYKTAPGCIKDSSWLQLAWVGLPEAKLSSPLKTGSELSGLGKNQGTRAASTDKPYSWLIDGPQGLLERGVWSELLCEVTQEVRLPVLFLTSCKVVQTWWSKIILWRIMSWGLGTHRCYARGWGYALWG